MPAATTAATVAAVAAAVDELHVGLGCADIFLVEHIERRQADIGDFLLTEREVIRIMPWKIGNRTRR